MTDSFSPLAPSSPGLYLIRFGDRTPKTSRVSAPWLALVEYRHLDIRPGQGVDAVLDRWCPFVRRAPQWIAPRRVDFAEAVSGESTPGLGWLPFAPPDAGWIDSPPLAGWYVMRSQGAIGPWYDVVCVEEGGCIVSHVKAYEIGREGQAYAPLVIPGFCGEGETK